MHRCIVCDPPDEPAKKTPEMDDGGRAFPLDVQDNGSGFYNQGMTLRDYFAAAALTGILANPETLKAVPPIKHDERAEAAYKAADAMLKERALPF